MDSARIELYLVIAIAIVAMMLLGGAIIVFVLFYQKKMVTEQLKRKALEFEYQQKMMQAELESQESERRRLAADLHDSIGGMLSTIRVGLVSLGRQLSSPSEIDDTKKMLDETITSVRRISRDLMPATLERFGLHQAIKELCERVEAASSIAVVFDEPHTFPSMEKERELMAFRIVQELLNNSLKHSGAGKIDVKLKHSGGLTTITVTDDGVGFDAARVDAEYLPGKGLGIFNMQNRTKLLGGELIFSKGQGQGQGVERGSRVDLIIPLTHE